MKLSLEHSPLKILHPFGLSLSRSNLFNINWVYCRNAICNKCFPQKETFSAHFKPANYFIIMEGSRKEKKILDVVVCGQERSKKGNPNGKWWKIVLLWRARNTRMIDLNPLGLLRSLVMHHTVRISGAQMCYTNPASSGECIAF